MKVLAAGDIHGDTGLVRELAEQAKEKGVDIVALCGDLTGTDENVEGVVGQFEQRVFLVPGNHDSPATINFLAELYGQARNIHGYGYKVGDIGFFGCSSVNLGLWQMTEEEIFDMIKKSFKYIEGCKKKILVSHVHPTGSKMETVAGFAGSEGLRKAIDELQPDIVLCSHVHEAEGIEELIGKTKVINVGRAGKILDL